jgi:uncharacterized protein
MPLKICLLFVGLIHFYAFQQKVLKENLTKKETQYWDFHKTKPMSIGTYYKDQIGKTTQKHGKWEYFFKEGGLEEVRNYYLDKLHGPVLLFYPNGIKRQEGYFIQGKQDSVYREWNETGKLALEGFYKDDKPFGIWKYYYFDGREKMVEEYIDTFVLIQSFWLFDSLHSQTIINGTGEKILYHQNGILKEFFTYKDGILDGDFEEWSIFGYEKLTGSYTMGKKSGEWKFYYYTGALEKIVNYQDNLLEGEYNYFYDNGQKNVEGTYQDGMKNGIWSWYTNKGTKDMSGNFVNDKQDGDWKYWYPTGELSYNAQFKNGLKHGHWEYFYKDGTKFKKGNYLNDEKNGIWETWYENGNILMTGKYINGKEDGKWLNYWENGKIKNETTFKNGVLNGNWVSYNPKGVLKLSGKYKDGYKVGEWINYFDNGKPKDSQTFKIKKTKSTLKYGSLKGRVRIESVQNGKSVSYSAKDYKKTEEGTYKNGEKHGEWIAYYPGGKMPAIITTYKNGKLDGPVKRFNRKGELNSQIDYKDGLKHGKLRIYDKKGKVVLEKSFEYGLQIIESKSKSQGSFTPGR